MATTKTKAPAKVLTKDDIVAAIAARAREVKNVPVKEWGGSVNIRRLDAADLEATGMTSGEQSPDIMLRVLSVSLCDDEGNALFGLAELESLHKADAMVTLRLFADCARYNGLLTGELEAMVGTFAEAPRDDSSSA